MYIIYIIVINLIAISLIQRIKTYRYLEANENINDVKMEWVNLSGQKDLLEYLKKIIYRCVF